MDSESLLHRRRTENVADLLSELRALKQALDEGLLTQDEHDRRKRKLLGEDELVAIPNANARKPFNIAFHVSPKQ